MADKTIFVTVGTTQFDDLIKTVTQKQILELFKKNGFNRLTLQTGNGFYEPCKNPKDGLQIEQFGLKESIRDDINNADLVISHAGAGTSLEVLELGKPLIVVINKTLMGNHQAELANLLESRNYAAACTVDSLYQAVQNINGLNFQKYPKPDSKIFNDYLNNLMGIAP